MNEHVDYQAKPSSAATRFLWWCAGADEKILKYSSYADHVKYVGIGGVVLATGFMAALSMGFAIHTIFDGKWEVTIPVALAWALIVFNLDRFIVSSTGKGDGDSTISFKELGNATPRLIMAILLGLTISAPLETQIFSREIEREWVETKDQLVRKKTFEIEQLYQTRQKDLEKRKEDKKKEVESQLKLIKEKEVRVTLERQSGTGIQWQRDTLALGVEQRKLVQMRAQLDSLENGDAILASLKINELDSVKKKISQDTSGFLDQIMMLEKLSSDPKRVPKLDEKTNDTQIGPDGKPVYQVVIPAAFWPIWLVRLLFMIIEIAPVLLKLMLIKSPYDYMTENVSQILEAKQGISLKHMPDEYSQIHKLKENFNPQRIIAIVEHQNQKEEENAKEAITLFAEKEKQEMAKDPEAFIKPDDSKDS
jgi:hypothetical protein